MVYIAKVGLPLPLLQRSAFEKKCCSLSNFKVQTKHDNDGFHKLDVLFLSNVIPDALSPIYGIPLCA